MSRLSYDSLIMNALKFVHSCPDFRAFMSRLSCVRQTFVRSCSDFRAFMSRLSCVRQTFVRSCSDFRAFMSRLSCVRQTFVRSCSDFRAFFDVSRLCNFERTTPPSCVHLRSGHTCFRLGPQPGYDVNLIEFQYLSSNQSASKSHIFSIFQQQSKVSQNSEVISLPPLTLGYLKRCFIRGFAKKPEKAPMLTSCEDLVKTTLRIY